MKSGTMRLVLGLAVLASLGTGAWASVTTVDDIVVGSSVYQSELVQFNSDMSVLRGKLWLDPTTRAAGLPDGNIVTVDAGQNLNIWRGTDRGWINGIAADLGATALAVDARTGNIAVGTSGGAVKLYNSSLTQIGSQAGFGGAIKDIAFQSDGSVLMATAVRVWRLDSSLANVLVSQQGFNSVTSLAVQSNDRIVIGDSVSNGGKVWVFSSDLINIEAAEQGYGAIADIAVQHDDDVLVATDTKLYLRNSVLTGGLWTGGFGAISSLGIQSNDQVIIGDSGTGKVYLYTSDLLSFAASPQGGFGTINSVAALVPEPMTLVLLSLGSLLLRKRN